MNLKDYETRIDEIHNATDLNGGEKRAALEMVAHEIEGCLWQPHAKEVAQELAAQALADADTYPLGGLEAMSGLAAKGWITAKRGA